MGLSIMNVPTLRFAEFRDAGEWEETSMGKVLSIGSGKDYKHLSLGEVPVYGTGGYMLSVDDYLYDGESVCIGRKGTIDKPILLSGKFWTVDTLFYTHSFKKCLPRFIYAYSQMINWKDFNEASGVPSLSKVTIEKIDIKIPGLPEQQKIADCLSSLDELIAAQTQKLDTLKAHKKGLMQQLFSAEGETAPKLRFFEFRYAPEWEEKTLGQVADYENGKAHEQDISASGKFLVVNSKFISTEGEVRKFTDSGFCLAEKEDILMVLSDVPNGRAIAKCFFVDSDNLYTVNQRICKIKPKKAVSIMLFYVLNRSAYFLAFDDGVKQTNLKKDDVLSCPILLPEDLKEQQKIADCLSSLDELIAAQTQKLDTLKTHKKGLMQQLFPSADEVAG